MLIDTHCHIDFSDFDPDRPDVIQRALEAGVSEMICIGTHLAGSLRALQLAQRHSSVWATVGIHPTEASSTPEDAIERLHDLAEDPRVVAIGEIGLDYHRLPQAPELAAIEKENQAAVFRAQLDLAKDLGLNVVIHERSAWDDALAILSDFTGQVRGVFHCFSGTLEQVEELAALGHLVSFTGSVTFKNATQIVDTARRIDPRKFMVETDAPYLAPVPHRGQRCEPAYARDVANYLAELRSVSVKTLAARTTENAQSFFDFERPALHVAD